MVLERDSSVLGYPGEISRALDADHHGVCKFESPEDPLYITVRNMIKSLVSRLQIQRKSTSPSKKLMNSYLTEASGNFSNPSKNDDLREIETLLAVSEPPDVDYIFYRDRWVPNTCGWILEQDGFQEWVKDPTAKTRILWLHGLAASGKSVLSSFISNHLVQSGLSCQYFFIRFSDRKKRSLSSLLRSIAFQVAQSLPDFRQGLVRLIEEATKLETADAQMIWQRIFKSVLCKIRIDAPLYWVIDGLDKSDNSRSFIKMISEADFTSLPIRVFVTSRTTQSLSSSFQKLSKDVQLDIIPYEGKSNDIRSYTDQELEVSGDEKFQTRVKDQILERASGNFLWVHLAVQRVNHCHTIANVESALRQMPPGMEALYDGMAHSIVAHPQGEDKQLASRILAWITCGLRILTVEELSVALEDGVPRPLDLQRSIGDLCGGFVVVDNGGNVGMVHQTAREYLLSDQGRPFAVDQKSAHEQMFLRCMLCLTDLGLRSKINRRQIPAFLDYATTSWFHHLIWSNHDSTQTLEALIKFLKGPSVLTWIQALAQANRLRTMVLASTQLSAFVVKRKKWVSDATPFEDQSQLYAVLEAWAIDFVKVVGKFGSNLVRNPDSIYKLIPPFCPHDSALYRQFGKKESSSLMISGFLQSSWDDSLARMSFGSGTHAIAVLAAGGRIAILNPLGVVLVHYASTCEETRRITHGERVLKMYLNSSGTLLVTYGYVTTKVWNVLSGKCVASAPNPRSRPRPHSIVLTEDDDRVLLGFDDRRVRSLRLSEPTKTWEVIAHIDEQPLEGTIVNSPTCMALSRDGHHVALGYRGHPVTVWELEGPELVGRCLRVFDSSTQSNASHAWGEVTRLSWHPYTGEVIGLYLEGVIFRWHPYHDETQEVHAGANSFAVSQDAKCLATGDPNGIVKLFSMADFSLVYQFASQDPVFDLCFAPDSRRLYDVRGSHSNVWEPNALIRLSESTEASDDGLSVRNLGSQSTMLRNMPGKIDPVAALATQPSGRLYCSGTESGLIEIFEAGYGNIGELRRSKGFMGIDHVVWSNDGRLVAFADLCGRLFVKSVLHSAGSGASLTVEAKLQMTMDVTEGAIRQIMFHPDSDRLLVYNSSALTIISLAAQSIVTSQQLEAPRDNYKWTNHPWDQNTLLAFGPRTIHVWSWEGLAETATLRYDCSIISQEDTMSRSRMSSSTNLWESKESIDRLLITADNTCVLVQCSSPSSQAQKQKDTLLFDVGSIPVAAIFDLSSHSAHKYPQSRESPVSSPHAGSTGSPKSPTISMNDPEQIQSILLPPELVSCIEIPLAFLSRDRLVFLDHNFWLCSWRLPLPSKNKSRRPSGTLDGSTAEIKRHYFLPSDWISPDSVALCTVMADGTLLCPRKGDVAVVKCAALRN